MNFAAIAIGWCLLAQVPAEQDRYGSPELRSRQKAPAAKIDEAGADTPPAETGAEPDLEPAANERERLPADREAPGQTAPPGGAPRKLRPPELLTQALEKLQEGALVGTPLTLQAALARSTDRQQQLKIAQAYWRLCTAQADYHWAVDQRDKLAHYTRAHTNSAGTLSARAGARADVRDTQLAVAQAQEDLVDLMGTHAETSPPLASDRPHIGDFHTYYDTIFANRAPPPRIRLIHRTLPVRRQAIDAHGEAIVAALDALESTGEHFQKSGQGLATILATLEELNRERRLFMADVRDYNQEFAEYAFATAPAGADSKTLVEMLILTSPRTGEAPSKGSRLRAAGSTASERGSAADALGREPREVQEQTSQYQHAGAAAAADEQGIYQGLLGVADRPQRVQRLANLLHWDRNLPPDAGEPTTLADCLRAVAPKDRLDVITAYWRTREGAARYQALNEQLEQLNALPSIAIELRDQPGMAEASVRLQGARRAAHAAVFDAQVALLESEFRLMQATGRRVDDSWLLPSTPPQSGRYLVAGATRGDARARYWSEMVRLEHEKLEERTDAIIQADVHRAVLMNETRRGADPGASDDALADEPMRLDGVLRAIRRQNQATLSFLKDLTGYNIAIAHFALAALPAAISSEDLVKKLVIARSTRRES